MKRETVAEFLARGGKVNKVPYMESKSKPETMRTPTTGGEASFITLEDADLFYGEAKPRRAKKVSKPSIDISALPEELRKKYIDGVLNEQSSQEDEDY